MSRFLGKFSFFYGNRMLVYFGNRAGLYSVEDRGGSIRDSEFNVQPFLPEYGRFLAYEEPGGTFSLLAHNGEPLALGGEELQTEISTVGTTPTGYPKYHPYYAKARFLLAPLRDARARGQNQAALCYQVKPRRTQDVVGFLVPSQVTAERLRDYDSMRGLGTNIERSGDTPVVWRFEQYADGVDEILATKKIRLFDFSQVGKAIVDVSGEEFRELDLAHADFRGANFSNATLFKCTTHGAQFQNANFNGAKILGGSYSATEFSDVTMQGTVIDNVEERGCNFTRVDMRTVQTPSGPFHVFGDDGKNYRTRFTQGKVSVRVMGMKWTFMVLDDAEIDGIEQIPDDKPFLANNASLSRVNLSKLKCRFADFTNSEMYGTILSTAKLPNATFTGAKLVNAVFSTAELQLAKFQNAQLSGARFVAARLDQANFDGATLVKTDFSNAYLESVNFTGIEQKQMSGVLFNRAFLVNSDMTGVDLTVPTDKGDRCSLTEAYLHGANLTGAQLAGTDLTSAGIATESGELMVKLPDLPQLPVPYDPTIIDPSQSTNRETVCPNGANGPCEGDKLKPKIPFPDSYPWPRKKSEADAA